MEDPLVVHKRLLADYERVCAENAKLKAEAKDYQLAMAAAKPANAAFEAENAKLKEVLKKIKVRLLAHGEWLD